MKPIDLLIKILAQKSSLRVTLGILCLGSMFNPVMAQNDNIPRVNLFAEYAELMGIDTAEKRIYTDIAKDKLSKLVYASTFGKSSGAWDLERYVMFSRLFTNDALITNFLQLKPSAMPAYNFLSMVDERVNPKAINFRHKTAVMRQMRKNASGDIEVTIQLDWELFSYFDKNGQLVESVQGRPTTLNAQLIIDPKDPTNAVFLRMTGETVSSLSNRLESLSVTVGYQSGSLQPLNSFGFQGVNPAIQGFGLQIHYTQNLGAGQKWFLWGGLQTSVITTKTDFTGKVGPVSSLAPIILESSIERTGIMNNGAFNTTNVNGILFATSEGKKSEEILSNSIVLQGILGVQRRWSINNKLDVYAGLGLCPQYLFANNNGRLSLEGYKLPAAPGGQSVVTNFPGFSEISTQGIDSYYRLTEDENLVERIGHQGNFSLNALLQASLRRTLGFGWGIEFAAQYQLGLGNMYFYSGGPEQNFPGKIDKRKTLLEDYASNSRYQGWGLRIGLFFEFGTKY
jgi:hypothetical protein